MTRVSSVLLRLHDRGRFHTRASVLQMVALSEVENHMASARSSEVSVKIVLSESARVVAKEILLSLFWTRG